MTFVDHLKGTKPEARLLEVAFGRHVIEGDLAKSIVTGADPTHVITVQHLLGDALGKGWAGPEAIWFRGVNRPPEKFKFYPGIMSPGNSDSVQGIDEVFDQDTPHSNTAWLRAECPNGEEVGIPDFDTKNNTPIGTTGIYKCQLGTTYDNEGNLIEEDVFLTNPADVLAFGLKEIAQYDDTRIDWESLAALQVICESTETPDYTTLPEGVGLTAKYYNGTSFDTFLIRRVDPVVQFDPSSGAPAVGLEPDNFSARFEGKVRPRFTETYTFYVTHTNGAVLWVDNLSIPLIAQWEKNGTNSETISLTADQFYDIKLEWKHEDSPAEIKLEWESASQTRQVISQDRLYPKNEAKKRFECHIAFTQRATLDDFLRSVLFTCNGGYQDADGKLSFFCIDELEATYDFSEENIIKNTFQFGPRFSQQELLNLPNRFIADGRDLDSQYLEKFDPQLFFELEDLQDLAGRVIEETVNVGNSTRWQALKNLQHYAKVRTADTIAEFEGMPQTLGVMPGDLVTVTHGIAGWDTEQFLVLEATDKSIDAGADNRIFKLLKWE